MSRRASASSSPAAPRTAAQNRVLWGLVGRLATASGLSKEELDPTVREMCRLESGQEHTRELTEPQAARVIRRLEAELASYAPRPVADRPTPAPHEPWGPRAPGPRESLPMTRFQGVVLAGLFRLVGYTDIRRQRGFCERQTGKGWPTTQTEADKVITPLAEMGLRHVDADDIRHRVERLGAAKLDRWKTGFVADMARQLAEQPGKAALTPHKLLKILECEAAAGLDREGA